MPRKKKIKSIPVLVINLDRSPERMERMIKSFPNETLIRIAGVDGREWEAPGKKGIHGRPVFDFDKREALVKNGIISECNLYPLIPGEVGCALGHEAAWAYMVENNIERAIILEDDIEPSQYYNQNFMESIEKAGGIPKDADILFLQGEDTETYPLELDETNHITYGCCNYAYLITLEGAEKAMFLQFPMMLPCDIQWWRLGFRTFNHKDEPCIMDIPDTEKSNVYGLKHAIIKRAKTSFRSTMTINGIKKWKINFKKPSKLLAIEETDSSLAETLWHKIEEGKNDI